MNPSFFLGSDTNLHQREVDRELIFWTIVRVLIALVEKVAAEYVIHPVIPELSLGDYGSL